MQNTLYRWYGYIVTGDELKQKRIAAGMTQHELAQLMGTTETTIARWERGERQVNDGWVNLAFEVALLRKVPKQAAATDGRRGPRTR